MKAKIFNLAVLISFCLLFSAAVEAAPPLKGSIQTEDYRIRAGKNSPQATPAPAPNFIPQNGMQDSPVNSAAFAAPSGRVQQDNLQAGLVQSQDFANLPKNFDIGADRGSKEMVLAWERWHKQLAAAIYQIWNGRANSAGKAVLRVTVYRNRTIVPEIMEINGTTAFRRTIMSVFRDLEGNPGLSFPSKSQRDKVSFEAEYIAGTDVNPGYSWLKGDYEKVRQDY